VMLNQWYHMLHLHYQWISCEIDDDSMRIRASFTGQLPFLITQLLLRSSINLLLDSYHLHSHAQACSAFGSFEGNVYSREFLSQRVVLVLCNLNLSSAVPPASQFSSFRGFSINDGSCDGKGISCGNWAVSVGCHGKLGNWNRGRHLQPLLTHALSVRGGRRSASRSICELLQGREDRGQELSVHSAQVWKLPEADGGERSAAPQEVRPYQPRRVSMRR
jgi:hypothetical protein